MQKGIEEFGIPKTVLSRVLKTKNVQIQKEGKGAMHKSCTIFISWLSTMAADIAKKNGKKTITAGDVYEAMKDEFPEDMKIVRKTNVIYQELQKEKRREGRRRTENSLVLDEEMAAVEAVEEVAGAEDAADDEEVAGAEDAADDEEVAGAEDTAEEAEVVDNSYIQDSYDAT